MRRLISSVCAAALIASTAVVPATASPLLSQPRFEASDSVIEVGSKKKRYRKGKKRYYKKRRHRNRYDDDWWIPGLIIGGIIVGSAIAAQPRYHRPAGSCGYWSQRCSANWSRPNDYYGCMRYHGC